MECERLLNSPECPTYSGEKEWLQEQKENIAVERLSGTKDNIPYVD